MTSLPLLVPVAVAAIAAACSSGSTNAGPNAVSAFNHEVPCGVAKVLAKHCLECHGDPPTNAAPRSFLTYASLDAPSAADPTQTEAQSALGRMQSPVSPMPPTDRPRLSADEIAVWQAWVSGGAPMAHCAGADDTSTGTGGSGGATGIGGSGGSGVAAGAAGAGGGAGAAGGPTGTPLPWKIATFFANRCNGCHGNPLAGAAPVTLTSVEGLLAPSPADPSKRVADVLLERLVDMTKPMPPLPQAPVLPDEVAAIKTWVNAGLPAGTCVPAGPTDGGTGGNPYKTDTVCTSGVTWPGLASTTMAPGEACVSCHKKSGAKLLVFGGTVYPTAHEPADCNGVNGVTTFMGASVVITDSAQKTFTMTVNAAGNFYVHDAPGFMPPYTAQVTYNGKVRQMVTPQKSGDCNGCHTQDGTTTVTSPADSPKAPGRIFLP